MHCCLDIICMFTLCMFTLCMFTLCMFTLCMFTLCMSALYMLGEAMMIQHNDSDTSCMRALALLERTFASEAELPPTCITMCTVVLERHVSHKHSRLIVTQTRSPGLEASRARLVSAVWFKHACLSVWQALTTPCTLGEIYPKQSDGIAQTKGGLDAQYLIVPLVMQTRLCSSVRAVHALPKACTSSLSVCGPLPPPLGASPPSAIKKWCECCRHLCRSMHPC